jgi:hypothetical protein
MGDLVNFRRFKKRTIRRQAEAEAQSQRARFGRTKAEKQRDDTRERDANALLDQHRLREDET